MEALGVESEIEDIRVGWSSVDVEGLRKSSLILRRSIAVNFVVEGDVNNPQFSLNLQHALASSVAETLGVSLGGWPPAWERWGRAAWRRWARRPRAREAPCGGSSGARRSAS